MAPATSIKETEITIYGATSFVAKHVIRYLLAVSLTEEDGPVRVTLAGRNRTKLEDLLKILSQPECKSASLPKHRPVLQGVFVAESEDAAALLAMAKRTRVVINCAGPYAKYSSGVVAACAAAGTDYTDITGETFWSARMRAQHGGASQASGARIVSLCGYDSIPSDLALLAAVEALRQQAPTAKVKEAMIWHQAMGMANGGTIHTALGFPMDLWRDFTFDKDNGAPALRPAPFLMGDPLQLAHPTKVRHHPYYQDTKNRFAWGEWYNQLPSWDGRWGMGWSLPFFMSPVNLKVLQASAVALGYGPKVAIRERWVPLGFLWTRRVGIWALVPFLCLQVGMLVGIGIFFLPYIGKKLAMILAPPGTGAPDWMVERGSNSVYAVAMAPAGDGTVHRGSAYLRFEGDAGNAVTAQCVVESALTLLLNREDLPPRSIDGFGSPAELLGKALLKRFQTNAVRQVRIVTDAKLEASQKDSGSFVGTLA